MIGITNSSLTNVSEKLILRPTPRRAGGSLAVEGIDDDLGGGCLNGISPTLRQRIGCRIVVVSGLPPIESSLSDTGGDNGGDEVDGSLNHVNSTSSSLKFAHNESLLQHEEASVDV
jgi:hypothetical protein